MATIDRQEIKECIGDGPLAAHAMETAEPFFRALEDGLTLTPCRDISREDMKAAVRHLRGLSAFRFQTPEDIAKSSVQTVGAAAFRLMPSPVGLADIEVREIFGKAVDEAFTRLLDGRLESRLIGLVSACVGDLLVEYFKAAQQEDEACVRALSPIVALLPKAVPTPLGGEGILTFLAS